MVSMDTLPEESFGAFLRRKREEKGYRLGRFANEVLKITATYLSDVERERRQPFGEVHLQKISAALDLDLGWLRVMAAKSRGAFELGLSSTLHQSAGAALMRAWDELDDEDLEKIRELAKGKVGASESAK